MGAAVATRQNMIPARFPTVLHLATRHHRTTTIEQVDTAAQYAVGFQTVEQVAHWIGNEGPVRLRVRNWDRFTADPTTGLLTIGGRKGPKITGAITGYDAKLQLFRALFPFGVVWGQLGRCWLTHEQVEKWLRDPEARFDAPVEG